MLAPVLLSASVPLFVLPLLQTRASLGPGLALLNKRCIRCTASRRRVGYSSGQGVTRQNHAVQT